MRPITDQTLKAVFLDLDDTLSDELHRLNVAYSVALAQFPNRLTSSQVKETLHHYMILVADLYERNAWTELSEEQRLRLALEQAGVKSNDDLRTAIIREYFRNYHQGLRLLPGAAQLLQEANCHCTCLITNGETQIQTEKLRLLSLRGYFNHILISKEFGSPKPDLAIFQHALNLTKSKPHQAIMIGNNIPTDIAGAANLGITTIWVNLHNWKAPHCYKKPDYEVPDLKGASELLCIIRAQNCRQSHP